MGSRKITVKQTAADNIAAVAWFIESKGMVATADKFTNNVYDAFIKLVDERKRYPICREPERAALGFKCIATKRNILLYLLNLIWKLLSANL